MRSKANRTPGQESSNRQVSSDSGSAYFTSTGDMAVWSGALSSSNTVSSGKGGSAELIAIDASDAACAPL